MKRKPSPIRERRSDAPETLRTDFVLNGKAVRCDAPPMTSLLEVLRDRFGLKGTKPGCNEGECGACTVLVDGAPVNACLYLAAHAGGREVLTIEGLLGDNGSLHPVQAALVRHGAVQCGFCSPGMAITLHALVERRQHEHNVPGASGEEPFTRERIAKWIEGNLCRCTGYVKIIDAAEELLNGPDHELDAR